MATLRRSLPVLAAAALLATGCGYNTIQTKDEAVNGAASQIKTQLQRRADLIPNLVETVKGFARQESTVFIAVADARSRLSGAVQSGDLKQMGEANQALNAPLGRLLAIVENYPELKSNANFLSLQDQLEGTENRISVARQDYNAAVQDLNTALERFPTNMLNKMFGFKPRAFFQSEAGAEKAPTVNFNFGSPTPAPAATAATTP